MKSIYESIKAVMLEYQMGNIGQPGRTTSSGSSQKDSTAQKSVPAPKKQANQSAPKPQAAAPAKDTYIGRVAKAVQGTVDNASVSQASKPGSFATAYSLRNTSNPPKVDTTKPAQVPQANKKPVAAKPDASQQARDAAAAASNKVNQAAVAKQKEAESGVKQAQAPTMSDRAATDANVAGTSKAAPKEVVAFKQDAQQASPLAPKPEKDVDRSPKAAEPAPKVDSEAETTAKKITNMGDSSNVDKEATFNRDRLKDSGVSPGGHTVQRTPEAEKYVAKTYTKPEVPQAASKEPDDTVKSGTGRTWKDSSGRSIRSGANMKRGPMGTPVPENFNVSYDLYNTVMEVLQKGSKPRNEKEKDLAAMTPPGHLITHGDVLKARGVKMKESMDTPGNSYEHQCAIHVKSESFGEGRTITTQHADPDENGNIAWYDVMFEHGIERYVPTNELEILVSESHMHSMKKKKKVTEAVRAYVDSVTGARPPANPAERDALAKQIKTNRDINRSDTTTTGYGNRVTPQKGVESAGTGSARGPVVNTGDFERARDLPLKTRVDPKATGDYRSQLKIPAGSGKMGGGGSGGESGSSRDMDLGADLDPKRMMQRNK